MTVRLKEEIDVKLLRSLYYEANFITKYYYKYKLNKYYKKLLKKLNKGIISVSDILTIVRLIKIENYTYTPQDHIQVLGDTLFINMENEFSRNISISCDIENKVIVFNQYDIKEDVTYKGYMDDGFDIKSITKSEKEIKEADYRAVLFFMNSIGALMNDLVSNVVKQDDKFMRMKMKGRK